MTASPLSNVTYFKRYRMELDLGAPRAVPPLPADCTWVGWHDDLLETHARCKFACFVDEIDGVVFPNLSCLEGCLRLMRDIRQRAGFCPEATWLVVRDGEPLGTVQGVSDKRGCGAIQNLGIVPGQRGSGIGTALLLQALAGFRRAGLGRAMLEVTAQNGGAIRLYKRMGFRFRKTIYKMVEGNTYPLAPAPPDWCV